MKPVKNFSANRSSDQHSSRDVNTSKHVFVENKNNYTAYYTKFDKSYNRYNGDNEKYKLHISISRCSKNNYKDVIAQCVEILMRASLSGLIDVFKIYNVSFEDYHKELTTFENMKKQDPTNSRIISLIENRKRQFNNPITIYLHEDLKNIAKLCMTLEKILVGCSVDINSVSGADIRISDHVIFRQETQNGKYASIVDNDADTNRSVQNALYTSGKNSEIFRVLTRQIFILQLSELSGEYQNSFWEFWKHSLELEVINKLKLAVQGYDISFSFMEYQKLMSSMLKKPYELAIENIPGLNSHLQMNKTILTREYFVIKNI